MATFQDPSGAFISAWQPKAMMPLPQREAGQFGWGELNARGVDKAVPFYQKVFGWTVKTSDIGPDSPPYNEFQLGGESIAGGQEMNKMAPAQMPSYWLVYFAVADVDKTFKAATQAGGREMVAPMDFRAAVLRSSVTRRAQPSGFSRWRRRRARQDSPMRAGVAAGPPSAPVSARSIEPADTNPRKHDGIEHAREKGQPGIPAPRSRLHRAREQRRHRPAG